MQCPACNATVQSTEICPRCRADLSVLLRIYKQSRIKLAGALHCWLNNQNQQSQIDIKAANSLHKDQLSRLVQCLINSQPRNAPASKLTFKSGAQLLQQIYQVSGSVLQGIIKYMPVLVSVVYQFLQKSIKRFQSYLSR